MSKIVVLNVDDDDVTLMLHKMLVKALGFCDEVENFISGESALEYLQSASFSAESNYIILLDINMPGMSGWDFLDKIDHIDGLKAYVALVTSSIDSRDQEKAKNYKKVIDFFIKPLHKNHLSSFFQKVKLLLEQ
ncbi:response regulator [Thermaurantimonas aggregans]|uniref:Response regulator n=1 Tax=Thermaurantimonas aggregans TaxID=2173829 RepID=A0A401XKY2_9FLAO|nr:response regulator [Thermaurantimonas aggregans]MCX8148232.1 response regulator [Thermaurantimonas aggregans]GCD77658.1 response regulator [Thermaurantimonas aggregans]